MLMRVQLCGLEYPDHSSTWPGIINTDAIAYVCEHRKGFSVEMRFIGNPPAIVCVGIPEDFLPKESNDA